VNIANSNKKFYLEFQVHLLLLVPKNIGKVIHTREQQKLYIIWVYFFYFLKIPTYHFKLVLSMFDAERIYNVVNSIYQLCYKLNISCKLPLFSIPRVKMGCSATINNNLHSAI